MIALLVLLPAGASVLAFLLREDRLRRALLVATASVHLAATVSTWAHGAGASAPATAFGGWLGLDATGRLVLSLASLLLT